MTTNPKVAKKERARVRRLKVFQYRLQGASYSAICEKLRADETESINSGVGPIYGLSPKYSQLSACTDYRKYLEELEALSEKDAILVKRDAIEKLDTLWNAIYSAAINGSVPAANTCMDILDRRLRLLGIKDGGSITATVDNGDGTTKNTTIRIEYVNDWRHAVNVEAVQ